MRSRRLYVRYAWAVGVLVAAVLCVASPTIGLSLELAQEGAPVAHRFVRHDHGVEPPLRLRMHLR